MIDLLTFLQTQNSMNDIMLLDLELNNDFSISLQLFLTYTYLTPMLLVANFWPIQNDAKILRND